MIKFFTTLSLVTLFALGGVAVAIPVLTKIVWPEMLMSPDSPPRGLPLGHRDFPLPEPSEVAITLSLPLQALTKVADEGIPSQIDGSKFHDFHRKISEGVIHWRVQPGSLALENTGKDIAFQLPFQGEAQSAGRFGLLKVRVNGSGHMSGMIQGRFRPEIRPDWRVLIPDLNPVVTVHQAQMTMGRNRSEDCRDQVRREFTELILRESDQMGPKLTEALNLEEGVGKLWKEAHVTRQLHDDPPAWVVVDPYAIEMSPIDYTSDPSKLSLTVGMVAQSFVTNTQPVQRFPDRVPHLRIRPDRPVTSLRVPIIVNYDSLNRSLAGRTFLIDSGIGATVELNSPRLSSAQNGYLKVEVGARVPQLRFGDTSEVEMIFTGKPIVNCIDQTLGFVDVSLTLKTTEAVSEALAWLFDEVIVETVQRKLRINLEDYLPEMETEIYRVMNSVPVPEGFRLDTKAPKVKLLGAYSVERNGWNEAPNPGIVFVMGATADIAVTVQQL